MRTKTILIATAAVALAAAPSRAQTCDCPATFEQAVSLIRGNYAGWGDKVTPATRDSLDRLTTRLRAAAAAARTDLECAQTVETWSRFFNDGHTGIRFTGGASPAQETPEQIRARFASTPRLQLTEAEVRRYLDENRARLDPAEGIYDASGAQYHMAVIRRPGERGLTAVVLGADSVWWVPGQIKARIEPAGEGRYTSRFLLRDHSEQAWPVVLRRNVLWFGTGAARWVRSWPAAPGDLDVEAFGRTQNSDVRFQRLSDSTVLLQLPSMDPTYRARFDSVVQANRDVILRTPNLIVDVRGNGGGADATYQPLLPLMYTDSIRSAGIQVLSTALNIANFQGFAADTLLPASSREWAGEVAATLRRHPGTLVQVADSSVDAFDTVYPFPRRVAMLVDEGCGSSCEQLVLAARQSRKVTLYGQNTAGVLDYANVSDAQTVCPVLQVRWATSRSSRLPAEPVDPDGIAPHVRLDPGEPFPIDIVRARLESAPDAR